MAEIRDLSTWRALNRSLIDTMELYSDVVLYGQDITTWGTGGGIHGVTKNTGKLFGDSRVRNTPISEATMISAAVGAAMRGIRPIVEIMYSDFALLGFDGIVNQAAKAHFMFGEQFNVPMVLRAPGGAGVGMGPQHSQSLEGLYAQVPGLEVVTPGSPNDAYWLLRKAVESPNPTIFLEHKALYNVKGAIESEALPLGKARVARRGSDITIVSIQLGLVRSLEVAESMWRNEGIDCEVIDLRSLWPYDHQTVRDSVAKTGSLLVVHEAPAIYGWGNSVLQDVVENCWSRLTAAPRLLGGPHMPVGYGPELEAAMMPSLEAIEKHIKNAVLSS